MVILIKLEDIYTAHLEDICPCIHAYIKHLYVYVYCISIRI